MGMSHAYGTVSTQKEAEELIERAIDEGYTFFDTAEIYGTTEDPHHNEKLLDLYYIHRIDMTVPIEETAGAVKELMEQGKIIHWGYQKPVKRLFDVHIKYARLQRFRTDIP